MMNNYYDMTREKRANRVAYEYWKRRIRERVKDQRKAELLAPTEPPHYFGNCPQAHCERAIPVLMTRLAM